ncbi:MAG: type II toxin-antitoxin system VapB family antitoxin [Thermodesulfobacteriota bacterium]|nr:type II toxin-antitoxin system VapB family antitoxin [Thermodesulfobacteriota bacterium]
MRTTVTLDETLIRELMEFSDSKTKTEAVALAVKDQIRKTKLKQLSSFLGKVDIDEKAIKEGDEADIKRAQWLEEIGKENDK